MSAEPTAICDAAAATLATIARHAAADAARAGARWFNRDTVVATASGGAVTLDAIAGEDAGVVLAARVAGALPGTIVLELRVDDAAAVVTALGGTLAMDAVGELERSMLQETGNILFTALMNSLARRLSREAVPRAPSVQIDLGPAAWGELLAEVAEAGDSALLLDVRLALAPPPALLRLAWLPAPEAVAALAAGGADERG